MTAVVRHGVRFGRDLVAYILRSGSWWLPVVLVVMIAASAAAAAAKVVVPSLVYTMF